ncbi:MAG: zincin-like metallopeptidase domain-containing protein [Bulleidia sp.]
MSTNVAKMITGQIVRRMEEAEKGTVFRWVRPWNSGLERPYSYETLKPYRGINRLLLDNDMYLTFNAVQRMNDRAGRHVYQIRKGANSRMVCFYREVPVKDMETGEEKKKPETGNTVKKSVLRYYRVFSREDVIDRRSGECLPAKVEAEHHDHHDMDVCMKEALEQFRRLLDCYCLKYGITLEIVRDGTRAYFSHEMRIHVPDLCNFTSVYDWVHTVAHEMAHSTGVMLGRFENRTDQEKEKAMCEYGMEELIAEIAAEMVCAQMKIPDDSAAPDNTPAYIHAWSAYLNDRPRAVITAASKAEEACEMIVECNGNS